MFGKLDSFSIGMKMKAINMPLFYVMHPTISIHVCKSFDFSFQSAAIKTIGSFSYLVVSMKPKPAKFADMEQFLEVTNDITGFLYSCWKYFQTK